MMYIIRQSDKDKVLGKFNDEPRQYNWHISEQRPRTSNQAFEDVCEIYADGHELEYIRKKHTNLPDAPTAHSVVWRGDFAQFIYDHLPTRTFVPLDETIHYR